MARESEILYTGTGGYVVALHRDSGKELWRTKLPRGGASQIVNLLLKGRQLFVGYSGRIVCLDADNGHVMWENGLPKTGYNPVIMTLAGAGASSAFVLAAHAVIAAAASASE